MLLLWENCILVADGSFVATQLINMSKRIDDLERIVNTSREENSLIRSELELLKRQDQRNRIDNKHMLSHEEKKKMSLERSLIEAKDLKEFDKIFKNFLLYSDENAYLFVTALCSGEKIVNFGRSNKDCPDSLFTKEEDYKRNFQLNDWYL